MATLQVRDPDGDRDRVVGLRHLVTTIGRGKANTVVLLGDPRASLRHASIERTAGGYLLRDEGSTNGTWVNGGRVAEHRLGDGDLIVVGDTEILFSEGHRRSS